MIYRTEHPKPQFRRENWLCLNGDWQFEFDNSNSGEERRMYRDDFPYTKSINVPFCPQSRLSGIEYKDFLYSVWYRREFDISDLQLSNRIFIHFGAVDYKATIYINEQAVGTHKGGYVSFKFDVTAYLKAGTNTVCIHAEDDERNSMIPTGKQSDQFCSYGCFYTRTTGIWQSVWLEFVPDNYIVGVKYYTNIETQTLTVIADLNGADIFTVRAFYNEKNCGEASVISNGGQTVLTLNLTEKHLWEIGTGGLYDLVLTYGNDEVKSYFGLRSIDYSNKKFYLNGKSVFQRLVLDQGFYPDGIYTAPSDRELENDIIRSMDMGFNGARLHQKVFEERFLYYADKHGYIVWGEYGSWGVDHSDSNSIYSVLPEFLEEIDRDYNHPSIVGWCPFNETWDIKGRKQCDDVLNLVYKVVKAADPYRSCIDTSGNFHVNTDIYDVHDYTQDVYEHARAYASLGEGGEYKDRFEPRQKYDGKKPFFVSEYGGILWMTKEDKTAWGYGTAPKNEKEFLDRLKGLTDALLDNPYIFGLCYTQLTDVEQEQNGLYTYDRIPKFPKERIYPIFARKAKIEE